MDEDKTCDILCAALDGVETKTPQNSSLLKVLGYVLGQKFGKPSNTKSLLKHAKLCLSACPENVYIRYMVNSVLFDIKHHKGIFVYPDLADSLDNKIFSIFSRRNATETTGFSRNTEIKKLYLQDPTNETFRKMAEIIRTKKQAEQSSQGPVSIEDRLQSLLEMRENLILEHFEMEKDESN